MPNYIVSGDDLTAVADAIRSKGGTTSQLEFPNGFETAIGNISGGGVTPTGTKQISITQNGTTTEDVTNYANAEITVNVPSSGGDGTPLYSGTIEAPVSPVATTFSVTLPKSISNCFLWVEADATTKASIYADTTSNYYLCSLLLITPQVTLDTGTKTQIASTYGVRWRGSNAAFTISSGATVGFNGSVMTVSTFGPILFPGGNYAVKVWEVAT